MVTRRQEVETETARVARSIVEEMGLELVGVEFTPRGPENVLCLYLDRADGITVDDLQEASQAVETALEVEEIVKGTFRLEVSSPGINRALKRPADFARSLGTRLKVKTRSPLPDGSRFVNALLVGTDEKGIELDSGEGGRISVAFENISSAKPVIDWDRLLRRDDSPGQRRSRTRRTS